MNNCPYRVGDRVRFKPAAYGECNCGFGGELGREVNGTVTQVNEARRWYRASYETPQGTMYECFKYW